MNEMEIFKNIDKSMSAVLMILAEIRENIKEKEDKTKERKIELLLADAGFNATEVAHIVNKRVPGVRKAIQRGRK